MSRPLATALIALGFTLLTGSAASAQTIYAPVQYQYGHQDPFYYGGSDPAVFDLAERIRCRDIKGTTYGLDGLNEAYIHPRRGGRLEPLVLWDCVPFLNARVFGYNQDDARNDAYLNVPRYFRKGDLIESTPADPDGLRVVPAQQRPDPALEEARRAAARRGGATTRPRAATRKIIIIPKRPAAPADKAPVKAIAAAK